MKSVVQDYQDHQGIENLGYSHLTPTSHLLMELFSHSFFFSSWCQGDIPAVLRVKGKNRVSVWLILILWMQSFGSQLNMDIALYNIPPFGWALGLDSPLSSLKLPKQKPTFIGYGRYPRGEKNCDTL